jgi:hypothetical protein
MVVVPDPLPLWWVPPEDVPEPLVEDPVEELVGAGAGAAYVGVVVAGWLAVTGALVTAECAGFE